MYLKCGKNNYAIPKGYAPSELTEEDAIKIVTAKKQCVFHRLFIKYLAKINLRVTPELVFELDDSMQYGEKIDNILKDIMKDIKPENQD